MDLDDRHRDEDGRISQKHGNTQIGTLRQQYGQDIAPGLRDDQTLRDWLDRTGTDSLSQALKQPRR